MERLREGVNSIAVKIILGLIILSFVFAGVALIFGVFAEGFELFAFMSTIQPTEQTV